MNSMNVLITGAASGIGMAAAEYFTEKGIRVYGIDKNIIENENIIAYRADITDEKELLSVRDRLLSEGTRLDAILSVAGMHDMASFVETDFDRVRRLLDVNLLGAMLTVKTFHPLLSEKGRVVIVTSEVATYSPMPFNGLYNISKTALDCYADSLRQELNLLGQKVVAVRPGAVATPLSGGSLYSTERLAEDTVLFRSEAGRFLTLVKRFMGTPIPPSRLAPVLYRATVKKNPRLAYSKNRSKGLVLLSLLPKRLQLTIIKMLLGRKKK